MNIGIIGAGFTGLSAAHTLTKKGHAVTVFEKDAQPGGLAIGYKEKEWEWTLEKHYHHWFTNDTFVLNLAKEIDHKVFIKRPHTNWYVNGKIYEFDSVSGKSRSDFILKTGSSLKVESDDSGKTKFLLGGEVYEESDEADKESESEKAFVGRKIGVLVKNK
jgi:protoporphyrinogen oxidase